MKIAVKSDLHLEFDNHKHLYSPSFIGEDVLLLPGDIQVGYKKYEWFTELLKDRNVIYILGNHEAYHSNFFQLLDGLTKFQVEINDRAAKKGYQFKLYCLQNQSVVINDIKFIGATLWTDFHKMDPNVIIQAIRGMTDYHVIKEHYGNPLQVDTIYKEHVNSVRFIEDELNKDFAGKKVLLTHHALSYQSVHEMYRTSRDYLFNYLYFSDLEHILEKADLAAHGHCHNSFNYQVGKCNIVCNPRGYYPDQLNADFDENLLINL